MATTTTVKDVSRPIDALLVAAVEGAGANRWGATTASAAATARSSTGTASSSSRGTAPCPSESAGGAEARLTRNTDIASDAAMATRGDFAAYETFIVLAAARAGLSTARRDNILPAGKTTDRRHE
jgi:hypothetical protein